MIKIALLFFVVCCASTSLYSQAMTNPQGFLADFTVPAPYELANSEADEYAPSFDKTLQRVVFTSERSGTAAQWVVNNSINAAELVEGTFNRSGHHRAFVSFGANGEAVGVAFVSGPRQSNPTIVSVPTDGAALNEGHALPGFSNEWFNSQPALSPDGNSLVFVSNREGGVGGLDLWVCTRQADRGWSAPVELSSTVNSSGDEITPVFVASDSLVYASNGYGGKGGFDLFLVVRRDGAWQEPEPLQMFNTEFDESDLTMLPDGTVIFASNRPGGKGALDLWVSRRR